MINVLTEDIDFKLKNINKIKSWIKHCVNEFKINRISINLIFCSDKYLYEINKKYLNHDTLTDIITFDYSEKNLISGDLLISIERVEENAKEFSNSFEAELLRVIIHGVLHLLSYNDKTENEKREMREKENIYIDIYKNKMNSGKE
ncbi:MAG: rRNA maturation RNase YbeY [Bacteroidota bacterium]|nr:rRNA maturation RNase YbeY [Bacteroidota bacterium]